MPEDTELLRRYAEKKSDAAFAELVRRHVNFVYSCALRRVGGDAHLAEDVTQRVFTALAGDAAALARREVLAGWLYVATRNASAQIVRAERRRKNREWEAHVMNELTSDTGPDADWERLRPVIDDALDQLGDEDREAVLLRFFEGKSFAEVGVKLRLTDNTARMRVERALDKLHATLARQGVTSTTAALGVVLANQAGVAAPAGLVASVTSAVLAGGGAAAASVSAWVTFVSMTKLQLWSAGALIVACGSVILWQRHTNDRQQQDLRDETARLRNQNEALRIEAQESDVLRRENAQLRQASARQAGNPSSSGASIETSAASAPVMENAKGMKSREAWRNIGRATPTSSHETVMWASDRGDLDVLVAAFVLSDAQKAEAASVFNRLPGDSRSKYGSPERMMALLFASGTPAAIEPVSEIVKGPDDTVVRARVWNDRKETKELELPFRRYPDGWRVVVPDWQMNKSLARLR